MPNFNNLAALEKYLLQVLADCMNEVGEKVNQLLKQHVETDVYDVGSQIGRSDYYNGTGEPTGQLRDSIINTKPVVSGNQVTTEVKHDSDLMEYDANTYLHGSYYFSPNDVRDMLPYLINEGKTGGLFGSVWESLKRPYMTNTYEELVSKDLIKTWMKSELAKRGIKTI